MKTDNLHPNTSLRVKKNTDIKAVFTTTLVFLSLLTANAQTANISKNNDKEHPQQNINTQNDLSDFVINQQALKRVASRLADKKTRELQQTIIENISQLQEEITAAKKAGKKNYYIRQMFAKVSPVQLSGNNNYCAAGANLAYQNIQDSISNMILSHILVSTEATPKELHLFSHPNISCPAFCAYYKQKLGKNYADRKSADFSNMLQNLEAGDILMIKSSSNTSSGLHCVTFEKYDEKGRICVKSLNTEANYAVSSSKISGIAKIPNQFRQELNDMLNQNQDLLLDLILQDDVLASKVLMAGLTKPTKTIEFKEALTLKIKQEQNLL